jgi:hypothetical protein
MATPAAIMVLLVPGGGQELERRSKLRPMAVKSGWMPNSKTDVWK